MARQRRYYEEWPERRKRLPANGIKAKSQRGDFGESWWAKRWVAALEDLGYGTRLTRGRTYARGGAVLNIDVSQARVSARVQGSQRTPYKVTMSVIPFSSVQWEQAIDAMAAQAIFAAKLLAGEMPREIEDAFAAARLTLFPKTAREIVTECSCPDVANPCKHIAAVYYLLGERFDEDPFLLFELRGRTKAQIIDGLRARRAATAGPAEAPPPPSAPVEHVPALTDMLAHFDEPGAALEQIKPQIAAPSVASAILRRYGPPPADTANELHMVYQMMTRAALERLFAG